MMWKTATAAFVLATAESAGGGLAVEVAIAARDTGLQTPVHVMSVYPIAGGSTDTESYRQNAAAKPLNKPMMEGFSTSTCGQPRTARTRGSIWSTLRHRQ